MIQRRMAIDAGIALVVLALSVSVLAAGGFGTRSPDATALDVRGWLLAVTASLPLVVRRRAPFTTYAVVAAGTAALLALRFPLDFPFGCVVAVYTLAAAYDGDPRLVRRLGALGVAAAFVPIAAGIYAATGYRSGGTLTGVLFWALAFGGTWLAGALTRMRHERLAELERRAARAEREAERERRLAAAEERLRIARELHDSAGHAINTILLQAGAARVLHGRDPERSQQAVASIEHVARDTIGEIDRLVHALREDAGNRAPIPADPAAIEDLVDGHRANGLRVAAEFAGARASLPRSVAWAAYRILQESLTNAARHGSGSADLKVSFRPEAVEIEVSNPTQPALPAATGGHGIVGMRERASLLGGRLETAVDDGVFRLRAVLPCEPALR